MQSGGAQSRAEARKTLVSSTPSLVPKIAAERAAREAEAAKAPSSTPTATSADLRRHRFRPPPAAERLDRRGSTSSKADEQHLWPMPFLQVRLRPPAGTGSGSGHHGRRQRLLIAAPNRHGSLGVWRNADSSVDMSTDELQRYASYLSREDNDSCPAIDIPNRVEEGDLPSGGRRQGQDLGGPRHRGGHPLGRRDPEVPPSSRPTERFRERDRAHRVETCGLALQGLPQNLEERRQDPAQERPELLEPAGRTGTGPREDQGAALRPGRQPGLVVWNPLSHCGMPRLAST